MFADHNDLRHITSVGAYCSTHSQSLSLHYGPYFPVTISHVMIMGPPWHTKLAMQTNDHQSLELARDVQKTRTRLPGMVKMLAHLLPVTQQLIKSDTSQTGWVLNPKATCWVCEWYARCSASASMLA